MKNGKSIVFLVCGLALCLLLGIFIGRNTGEHYVKLPDNKDFTIVSDEAYKLDLNTAGKAQLMEIPGIGETIADRILEYRDRNESFTTMDELMNIEGIGKKKLLQIEAYLKVGG